MALPKIHTIGYEGASIEDLVASLRSAGVTRLIDARQSPYSRRPEFSKDEPSARLAEYAAALGLKLRRFNRCLASERSLARVREDYQLGEALGVEGTPTFFVNGYALPGALPAASNPRLTTPVANALIRE